MGLFKTPSLKLLLVAAVVGPRATLAHSHPLAYPRDPRPPLCSSCHRPSYLAFSLVWTCQLKDDYWQEKTGYTSVLAFIFILLPLVKMAMTGTIPPYNTRSLTIGAGFLLGAGVCFWLSMDDAHDPYKVLHGIAQVGSLCPSVRLCFAVSRLLCLGG